MSTFYHLSLIVILIGFLIVIHLYLTGHPIPH